MAKLPSIEELGPAPQVNIYRPASVGGFDASGLDRGEQAMARGLGQLGQGLDRAGQDFNQVAAADARWQIAQAQKTVLTGIVSQDAATAADPNYGKDDSGKGLANRHAASVWGLRDQAAAQISDPTARQHFLTDIAPTVERSVQQGVAHERSKFINAKSADYETSGQDMARAAVAAPDDATKTSIIDAHNNLTTSLRDQGIFTPLEAVAKGQAWVTQYATADFRAAINSGDPQRVQGAINRMQGPPGTPAATTDRILENEGTGKNSRSSATGAGQFIDSTWLDMIKKNRPDLAQGKSDADILSLRADKSLGRDMTEAYATENAGILRKNGVEPTPGNIYMAHVLGPAGAVAVAQADPKMPIADALAKAVGPDKAQAMIAANPSILAGQLAGSVKQWADGKMGGDGHVYDVLKLQPALQQQLIGEGETALHKQSVESRAQFVAQEQDSAAEALNTGTTTKPPLSQAQFVAEYGAAEGPFRYQEYDAKMQAGRVRASFAQMTPEQRQAATDSLAPQPGEANYAVKQRNHDIAARENLSISHELKEAPADFALQRSPAAKDAWDNLQAARSGQNTAMPPQQAAANYAAVTTMEQRRAGASEPRILPKNEADGLAAQLKNPVAAGGEGALLNRIESESKLWGDSWPQVYREIAPKLDPTLRVVAAGVDPTAGKLLLANHDVDEAKILGTQYAVKNEELKEAVIDALAPIAKTFVADDTRIDYQTATSKLAAVYVARGVVPKVAAKQAVNELIGSKYDVQGDYRVPHDAGVTGDQVAAGVSAAKADMGKLDLASAADDLGAGQDYVRAQTPAALARDGKWVTDPNERGLMLSQGGHLWPSASDPAKAFMLTWAQLADLAAKRGPAPEPAAGAGL